MSASLTILPMFAPARLTAGSSNREFTPILRALPCGPRWHDARRQRTQPSHRNREQQPAPPPNFWARHGRELLGVSVLVAGLLIVLWPDTLLPLAVAALILGLTLLAALVVVLAWRRQPLR